MEYYFNWVPVPIRNPKISSLIQRNVNGQRRRKKGEREGRSEKRRRGKRKNKEKKERGKRQEQSVQRREERKTQTKRGRGKRREKLAEGREETEEEESVFFSPLLGILFPLYLAVRLVWPKIRIDFFLPFNWASEKIGPWLAVHYLFSLILGSSAMSAHSLRSNFVFPFTWASHLLAKLEVIILLPCPWAFHFKPATFTKSYGYAGYALVLFTILG